MVTTTTTTPAALTPSISSSGEADDKLFVDRRAGSGKPLWSRNHLRLLYLLSKFAMYPSMTDDEESWLRNLPLLVLVYEAIVSGILDYDYSPVCTNIVKSGQSRRIWMNISQDAKAAIDDLREHSLVKALKTCSEDFQPSTAFQVHGVRIVLLPHSTLSLTLLLCRSHRSLSPRSRRSHQTRRSASTRS